MIGDINNPEETVSRKPEKKKNKNKKNSKNRRNLLLTRSDTRYMSLL